MLEQIRASEPFAKIPVVAISASDDRDMVSQMIKLGVVDYLLKPLNITAAQARLTRVFKSLLTEYSLAAHLRSLASPPGAVFLFAGRRREHREPDFRGAGSVGRGR